MSTENHDCTYLYFKPGGKWKYAGRGVFPHTLEVDREAIKHANGGKMPGISSGGEDYIIVLVPDEDSAAAFAYPRMLRAIE
jgi:hypothetical protein